MVKVQICFKIFIEIQQDISVTKTAAKNCSDACINFYGDSELHNDISVVKGKTFSPFDDFIFFHMQTENARYGYFYTVSEILPTYILFVMD